jgi:hypothetical protein
VDICGLFEPVKFISHPIAKSETKAYKTAIKDQLKAKSYLKVN